MRALVLTTSYPLRAGSVSGSFVRDLLIELSAVGWSFDVVTPAGDGESGAPPHDGIAVWEARHWGDRRWGGLAHGHGIPETLAREPWKWALAPVLITSFERRARTVLATRGADLIWSHWLFPSGLLGAHLARSHEMPHLATAHGADVHLLERLVRLPGIRPWLRAAWSETRIVAPAAHTARRVSAALGGVAVGVCPLSAARAVADGPSPPVAVVDAPRLLFLGRLEPVKGPDLLLEACAALERRQVSEIILAGSGSMERGLRVRAARLAHRIRFPGVLEAAHKARAFAAADALVVCSRRLTGGRTEGLPHAAMEAAACGRPVIAPGEGAIGEWLARTGAGLAFDPGRSDRARARGLAAALARFAAEPALRVALAHRARRAGREFHPGAAVARWSMELAHAESGTR